MRKDEKKIPAMIFLTWEEAKESYYKTNDIMSDDVDAEEGKIMRWLEEMDYEVSE